MLSASSFNALLKTLEEPPPHVKFLLATTDPQKLPVTVLSRCLQFNLKRLTPKLIHDRLAHICEAEEIEAEVAALAMLARAADGSLRDALSLLDQAIAYCGGKVEETSVALMLGTIDRDHVIRLLRLLAAEDAPGIIDTIAELDELFPDYARLLEDLARMLQRIAVFQIVGTVDVDDDVAEEVLASLAATIEAPDVQLFYQTALIGRRDLHLSPDPRSGAEMTLLRMLTFKPAKDGAASGGGGADSESRGAEVKVVAAPRAKVQVVKSRPATSQWQDPNWGHLVASLGLAGPVRLLASNCVLERRDGDTVYFSLDPRSDLLLTAPRKEAIAEALSRHFGERLRVDISVSESVDETPNQAEVRVADEQINAARASLESDPNVQTLKNMFGAELNPDSIELLNPPQSD